MFLDRWLRRPGMCEGPLRILAGLDCLSSGKVGHSRLDLALAQHEFLSSESCYVICVIEFCMRV